MNISIPARLLTWLFFCVIFISTPSSAQVWKWATGSLSSGGLMDGGNIVVSPSGDIFEIGNGGSQSADTLVGTYGPFVIRDSSTLLQSVLVCTDSNGTYRWVLATQGGGQFTQLAIDPYGYLYVLGTPISSFTLGTQSYSGSRDFIAKVSSAGNVLWIKPVPGSFTSLRNNYLSVTAARNIVIAGSFAGLASLGSSLLVNADPSGITTDVFYALLDSSGSPVWAKCFGGTDNDEVLSLAVTVHDEILIGGAYHSASMAVGSSTLTPMGSYPRFVARFTSNGTPLWAKPIYAKDTFVNKMWSIAGDHSGNVYCTGSYVDTFFFAHDTLPVPPFHTSMYIVRYDSFGNEKWARTMQHGKAFSVGYSISTDLCDNIWLSGGYDATTFPDTMFLARYDTTGTLMDTLNLPSGGDDPSFIATDSKGNLFVGGDNFSLIPFVVGTDTLPLGSGIYDNESIFILKYSYDSVSCLPVGSLQASNQQLQGENKFMLYPNPAHTSLTIQCGSSIHDVAITNMLGQTMYTQQSTGNEVQVDVSAFPAGMYLVRVNGGEVQKWVKE